MASWLLTCVDFRVHRIMRYAQGGELSFERRAFRERAWLQAAERFARDESSTVITWDLRINVRSVQRWPGQWRVSGAKALRSHGSASLSRLGERQLAALEQEPAKGPIAHGWPDQHRTLSRITVVIERRFQSLQ
ncbi:hypothetical protein [Streptosporangium sp. NPDC002721]|uniref:hypothetical protein n=1 Tax=Streptosporangium sp. NPDC002721 TaxID=3366188 RepID=UPI00369F3431